MADKDTEAGSKRYRVLNGINYPPGQRAEIGDIISNLLPSSAKIYLRRGYIEVYPPEHDAGAASAVEEVSSDGSVSRQG